MVPTNILNCCPGKDEARCWRALVVDDMPEARRLTSMLLSALGGQVTTAANGTEAVEIVHLVGERKIGFDLIVTAIQMPVMNGIEATRRMRGRGFDGPIIAVSRSGRSLIRDMCLAAGCDEFVCEPVSLENLASIVQRYCQTWTAQSDLRECMSTAATVAVH